MDTTRIVRLNSQVDQLGIKEAKFQSERLSTMMNEELKDDVQNKRDLMDIGRMTGAEGR